MSTTLWDYSPAATQPPQRCSENRSLPWEQQSSPSLLKCVGVTRDDWEKSFVISAFCLARVSAEALSVQRALMSEKPWIPKLLVRLWLGYQMWSSSGKKKELGQEDKINIYVLSTEHDFPTQSCVFHLGDQAKWLWELIQFTLWVKDKAKTWTQDLLILKLAFSMYHVCLWYTCTHVCWPA